jgi:hypothetical protein
MCGGLKFSYTPIILSPSSVTDTPYPAVSTIPVTARAHMVVRLLILSAQNASEARAFYSTILLLIISKQE